ncbi:hypothetical protein SCHPADRAFT_946833 [Schizopora paradoxa]|uniref:Uncharacterized protein n=1 Tax=Schizopora paradoxa TaxID=27342 RepID=A0A0H2R1D2_9AGAM|nr:hypothetical protein SCHPADRAFT_946833 [Schizopora paradoxa]
MAAEARRTGFNSHVTDKTRRSRAKSPLELSPASFSRVWNEAMRKQMNTDVRTANEEIRYLDESLQERWELHEQKMEENRLALETQMKERHLDIKKRQTQLESKLAAFEKEFYRRIEENKRELLIFQEQSRLNLLIVAIATNKKLMACLGSSRQATRTTQKPRRGTPNRAQQRSRLRRRLRNGQRQFLPEDPS